MSHRWIRRQPARMSRASGMRGTFSRFKGKQRSGSARQGLSSLSIPRSNKIQTCHNFLLHNYARYFLYVRTHTSLMLSRDMSRMPYHISPCLAHMARRIRSFTRSHSLWRHTTGPVSLYSLLHFMRFIPDSTSYFANLSLRHSQRSALPSGTSPIPNAQDDSKHGTRQLRLDDGRGLNAHPVDQGPVR